MLRRNLRRRFCRLVCQTKVLCSLVLVNCPETTGKALECRDLIVSARTVQPRRGAKCRQILLARVKHGHLEFS